MKNIFFLFSMLFSFSVPNPESFLTQYESEQKEILNKVKEGVVTIETNTFLSQKNDKSSRKGSGFIINKALGIIATDKRNAGYNEVSDYEIKFFNGYKLKASFLYADPVYNFAFLKVDPQKIPKDCKELKLSSDHPAPNQQIYFMGTSAQDEFATGKGTIFTIFNNVGPSNDQSFSFNSSTLEYDSGGSPVFDKDCQIVGMLYEPNFVSASAIPASYIKEALDFIIKKKFPIRYDIGALLAYSDLSLFEKAENISSDQANEYRKIFPEAQNKIITIKSCLKDSIAASFFLPGDIIWSVNGKKIGPYLYNLQKEINSGKDVTFQVYRSNELLVFKIKPYLIDASKPKRFLSFAGCIWYENTFHEHMFLGEKEKMVLVKTKEETSLFKTAGLIWGDLAHIHTLNDHPIKNLDDVIAVIQKIKEKKIFKCSFNTYKGNYSEKNSMDRQPRYLIENYEGRFDSAKLFMFNQKTLQWETKTF